MVFKKGRLVTQEIAMTEPNSNKHAETYDEYDQLSASAKISSDQTIVRRVSGKATSNNSKNSDKMQYEFNADEIEKFVNKQVEMIF